MTKRQITVPPKEEHCVNGRYYRAGETYSAPTAAKGTKKKSPVTTEAKDDE